LHSQGVVRGAVVTVTDPDGTPHNITVQAKAVVVSAGTLHTPAVLMRSGLTNANIGENLYLHPTTVTTGLFDERIEPWRGAPLTRVVRDFKDLDGSGYGIWLENAPAHPGINGLASPWINARQHRRTVQDLPHTANIIILTRDRDGGRVSVDRHGQPVVHYRMSDYDAKHLMFGIKEALKIHVAAGAKEVYAPHNDRPAYRPATDGSLDAFLERVGSRGLRPNDFALFSAHQMSTARIGGDPARGVLDPTGQTWEVKNLFVADGAALPNAPGVNPMISIMGVSHYIAQHVKAALS
jgi:choline dehydrogenase-like flavoprotein